jgi:hypothetical protein
MNFNELEKVCVEIQQETILQYDLGKNFKTIIFAKHSDPTLGDSKGPLFF